MATTTFVDRVTPIMASWLNDVDEKIYQGVIATSSTTRQTLEDHFAEQVSVKSYGATGNGTTDDTSTIQAAITANYGKQLFIPKGIYKLSSQLLITDTIELLLAPDAILNYSGVSAGTALGEKRAIRIEGSLGDTTSLTANIVVGDRQISFATSGFAKGDWIIVQSAQEFMPGVSSYTTKRSHIARILTIDSSTTATLTERSPFAYTAASTGTVRKINVVPKVTIKGGQILGGGDGLVHNGISAYCTSDLHVGGVFIDGCEDTGVSTYYSIGFDISRNRIENCISPDAGVGNSGYGVAVYGSSYGKIEGNHFLSCRHPVSGGSFVVSRNVLISKNFSEDGGIGTDGYDCHEPCFNWVFDGNVARGGDGGMIIRGQYTTITNNTITGVEGEGISVHSFITNTDGITGTLISGNTLSNIGGSGIVIDGTSTTERIHETSVYDNDVRNCGFFSVYATYFDGLDIRGGNLSGTSTVTGTSGSGIRAVGTTAGDNLNLAIHGVNIESHQRHGIDLQFTNKITISAQRIATPGLGTSGSSAISAVTCDDLCINGGVYEHTGTSTQGVISVDGCDRLTITNATITGNAANGSQHGIRWFATTGTNAGAIFMGNRITVAGGRAIYSTDSDRIVALGNDGRAAVNATKLEFTGAVDTQVANNII